MRSTHASAAGRTVKADSDDTQRTHLSTTGRTPCSRAPTGLAVGLARTALHRTLTATRPGPLAWPLGPPLPATCSAKIRLGQDNARYCSSGPRRERPGLAATDQLRWEHCVGSIPTVSIVPEGPVTTGVGCANPIVLRLRAWWAFPPA